MRVVVIGAGAIGGVIAAYLTQSHAEITLVCRDKNTADIIRTQGIHIGGIRGQHCIRLNAVAGIEALHGEYDICLIVTKAYDLEDAAKRILPFLSNLSLVVSVQNGMCWEILEGIVGKARTAACVVSWSSTQIAPARLDLTSEGGFIIGRSNGEIDDKIRELKALLDWVAPTMISDHIFGEIFAKLIINSGVTCGGAITGLTLGGLLKRNDARKFFISLVREDIALAGALGVRVPPFAGRLDYYRFLSGNGILDCMRRHLLLLAIGLKYRRLTSSSLTALQRGQPTEVAYLNGWICRKARELGVPVPINERVCKITSEIENGLRKITPANLAELSAP